MHAGKHIGLHTTALVYIIFHTCSCFTLYKSIKIYVYLSTTRNYLVMFDSSRDKNDYKIKYKVQ